MEVKKYFSSRFHIIGTILTSLGVLLLLFHCVVVGGVILSLTSFQKPLWLEDGIGEGEAEDSIVMQHQINKQYLLKQARPKNLYFGNSKLFISGLGLDMLFNDSNEVQLRTAQKIGVPPFETLADLDLQKHQLEDISNKDHLYFVGKLTHSKPLLTPYASKVLEHIALAFQDSLYHKGFKPVKFKITSVLRTEEHIKKLTNANGNASVNSCHRYGTTFDISYARFTYKGEVIKKITFKELDAYKRTLAEVLRDFKDLGLLYVKYEKKQPCFHITVR